MLVTKTWHFFSKGPIYDVQHSSQFVDMVQKADELKNLVGPIYDFGTIKHGYGGRLASGLMPHVEALKNLAGPIFNIDRKHGYDEVPPLVQAPHDLIGPVFDLPENRHQYRLESHYFKLLFLILAKNLHTIRNFIFMYYNSNFY